MGKEKKHKKHKSDRREKYEELPGSRPPVAGSSSGLRMVLKVGATPEHEPRAVTPPPAVAPLRFSMSAITEAETHRKEKKHKKKKKKDKEKDREHRERHRLKKERRHQEVVWPASMEDSSRLSSGTEPLSQGTASSPEEPVSVPPQPPPSEPDQWQPPGLPPSPSPLAPSPSTYPAPEPGPAYDQAYDPAYDPPHDPAYGPPHDQAYDTSHDQAYDTSHDPAYDPAYNPPHDPTHDPAHDHCTAHAPPHDPYTTHAPPHDPYTTHAPPHDPYTTHAPPHDPYTTHAPPHDPYTAHAPGHPPAPYDVAGAPPSPPPVYAPPPLERPMNSLQRFLVYLLRGLEKKDTQRFFRAPVTDLLAPGYSNVIRQPMDFSSMLDKVHANLYSNLAQFQGDFRLMCTNAMAYNRSDTIYHKAAKRLLHIGTKMMMPEKLVGLRTVVPAMLDLTPDVLGFEVLPPPLPASAAPYGTHISSQQFSRFVFKRPYVRLEQLSGGALRGSHASAPDPVDEEAEAEEILKQVQEAARRAAERVAKSKKAPKLGFLRRQADGSTSMAILTPSAADTGEEEQPDKPISLGVMTGRLSYGSAHLAGYREDRRNVAKPVKPVYYGIYGSFGPWYDSAFATVSKGESELLAQTYGGETAQQYAQSVRQFADGCQMATQMMDQLLDILTDGRHRRARSRLDQHRQLDREERAVNTAVATAVPTTVAPPAPQVDLASLRSLSKLGIDVGFVDALEADERRKQEAQSRLEHTSELLVSLSAMQRRRLSQAPESGPTAPSKQETELADALAGSLAAIVRKTRPGDVAAPTAVRKALGVGPVSTSPDNPSSHEEVDVEAVSTAATPEVRRVDTPPTSTASTAG